MKYAVLSDIHGNYPALRAALADAREQGAEHFLFLGDYTNSLPWPNEVVETIRGLASATVIRGNHENYLRDLRGQDSSLWEDGFDSGLRVSFRTHSKESLDYLDTLPETAVLADGDSEIHLVHLLRAIEDCQLDLFYPSGFSRRMAAASFDHAEYLALGREALLACPQTVAGIRALSEGAHLFGHSHLQFHLEYEGRLLVNPGSCGSAADWDNTAAYTLLERVDGGWVVTERRVAYDISGTVAGLNASPMAAEAPVWRGILEQGLRTGRDGFGPFMAHTRETAGRLGRAFQPVSREVWAEAVRTWEAEW